jgi:hypothetical protein
MSWLIDVFVIMKKVPLDDPMKPYKRAELARVGKNCRVSVNIFQRPSLVVRTWLDNRGLMSAIEKKAVDLCLEV